MPDNTVFYYDIETPEVNQKKLAAADEELGVLKKRILAEEWNHPGSGLPSRLARNAYALINGARSLHVTDACIHCEKCERNCPDGIIHLENGKPVWTDSNCAKCTACINRCPAQAVQYGKKT